MNQHRLTQNLINRRCGPFSNCTFLDFIAPDAGVFSHFVNNWPDIGQAAKDNLQKYTAYRRFKNEEGVVEWMDDNVRLQKIQEAKDNIQEFCD